MRQTSRLIRPAQCREQQRSSSILFYLCCKLRNWNSGGIAPSMFLIIQWSKLSLGYFQQREIGFSLHPKLLSLQYLNWGGDSLSVLLLWHIFESQNEPSIWLSSSLQRTKHFHFETAVAYFQFSISSAGEGTALWFLINNSQAHIKAHELNSVADNTSMCLWAQLNKN